MQTHKRTTITMIAAGPDGARFGVFRALVRNPDQRWTWNIHRAIHVATIEVASGERRQSYRAMAEQYATTDWPALSYPEEN